MLPSLHVQLRTAREQHGYSQHKLAELAGVGRSDIQRLERGDNVGIRLLEKVIAQLPNLGSLQLGGVEIIGRITVDVETVRKMMVEIITTSANVLQVLGDEQDKQQPEPQPAVTPQEPAGIVQPPTQGPVGATRYRRKRVVSEATLEQLRRINPVYKASQAAREAAAQRPSPAAPPAEDGKPTSRGDES